MALLNDLFGGASAPASKTLPCLPSIGRYPAARFKRTPAPPPAKESTTRIRRGPNFGGGGASNGIELALESLKELGLLPEGHSLYPDFAVNHDEPALAMHAANHPKTIHLPHNVWKVNMRDLLGDDFFGLLWLSPDCRDHSPAKGGPITSRSVRDLAWVLVRWLKELPDWQRPWMIALENVPAFSKWSPLIPTEDGYYARDPEREGHLFHLLIREVCKFGYTAGWTRIKSCEQGDPTIRDRLYLAFRRDGEEVDFPEPTHGDPKSRAVRSGKLEPWPVAANIIDFDRRCPSIFMTKEEARAYTKATGVKIIRPLKFKTDARLAKGVKRHVIDAGDDAYIATCNHGGDEFRGQRLGDPFATVARARDAHGLVVPHIVAFRGDQIGRPVTSPLASATANSFIKRPGGASPLGLSETLLAPFISRGQHGGGSRPAGAPLHTIAASDGDQNQVVAPYLVPRYGERDGQEPRSLSVTRPAPTPVPDGNGGSLAAVFLAQHNGGPRAPIARPAGEPVATAATAGSQQQLVQATFIKRDFGNSVGSPMRDPLGAATCGGGGKADVVAASMLSLKGSDRRDGSCEEPHPAVCASGQHSAVVTLPLMTAYYSTGGQSAAIDDPMLAVPTKARFGLTYVDGAPPPLSPAQYARARQVADFLRLHGCWDGGELVTVTIRGVTYIIVDIGMRMLTPRELARAQGFPDWERFFRIEGCNDNETRAAHSCAALVKSAPVPFAEPASSPGSGPASSKPAVVSALIDLGRQVLELRNAGRSPSSASTAGKSVSFPLPTEIVDSARRLAPTDTCRDRKARLGVVAAAPNGSSSTPLRNGTGSATSFGGETTRAAVDAASRDLGKKAGSKFTTSPDGQSSQSIEATLETLSCFVTAAIASCTPDEMSTASSSSVDVTVCDGYILAAPYKGKVLTETEQRHKIGNSVCRRPAAAFLIANYRPPLDWGSPGQRDDKPFFLEAAE